MPRSQGTAVENNFVQGLITETTALKFPSNACTETYDCVFDSTGEVTRRPNFIDEPNAIGPSLDRVSTDAMTEFQWTGVAGSGSKSFVVLQHGRYLRFYNNSTSNDLSPNRETFTVDLNSYRPGTPTIDPAVYPCAYAQGDGKLFVANRGINPIYVTYDATGNTITTTAITLKERDFAGATESGWDDNERASGGTHPIVADPNHWYNLMNQSWHTGLETGAFASGANIPIELWDAARSDFPSNADSPWLYIGATGSLTGVFDVATVGRRGPGLVRVPQGHFKINVFGPDRTQAQIDANVNASYQVTVTGDRADNKERPQAIAFFAGRIWYSGINHSELATSIYFSRIVEKTTHYGQCYQDNDPTTQDNTDLLPSDGGVIKIPEVAEVVCLFPVRSSLVVFTTNGVWIIKGSDALGFRANDYVVEQVTTLGTRNRKSFVNFKNMPIWWGEESILTLGYDANYNSFTVTSLTDPTIDTFFQAIPKVSREYAKGAYDVRNDIVYWVYHSTAQSSGTFWTYDRVLALNGTTKAFYPWTINSAASRVVKGIIYAQSPSSSITGIIKYPWTIAVDSTHENVSFGQTTGTTYLDWGSTDYESYFITGYRVDGQANKHFQSSYVTTLFNQETNSSCLLQGYFDFANSSTSGKWSTVSQVYRATTHRAVTHSRIKVRGKGPSLQLKFSSETGKPFNLIGWIIWITGSSNV